MSAPGGRALHQQLSVIMAALSRAAVAEICGVVEEGYAALQMEISRSHQENEELKKKLRLIQSIVVRGTAGGGGAAGPGAQPPETPRRQEDGRAAEGEGEGEEQLTTDLLQLPEVVLIRIEDEDADSSFDKDRTSDGGLSAGRQAVGSPPVGRSVKRRRARNEAVEKKSSSEHVSLKTPTLTAGTQKVDVAVYILDSPRSEPGCSAPIGRDEAEAGLTGRSSSSQMDPDVHVVHQERLLVSPSSSRQTFFGNSSVMESPCLSDRAEMDLSLTGSSSAFEYEDGDLTTFALYGNQSGRVQAGESSASARQERFICCVCNKTYATSQNLDVHMRIHTGERPFSCSQCGKRFTQSAHLKTHLSVHSGERSHACTLCCRSFIAKYSLKLHMKKCHPNTSCSVNIPQGQRSLN